MIFRDGASPAANTETAPTGPFANSGWQYQVNYVGFHGTMISPKHFVTANHVGASGTVASQPLYFNGVENRVFNVKGPSVRIATTDLRIFEIWETFEDYAPLYTSTNETGKDVVVSGRGVGRGDELVGKGWKWGLNSTRRSRWGRNEVQGVANSGSYDFLFMGFDNILGQDEVMLTNGDSGGGWFIKEGGIWKLAAVTFSVDAFYSDTVIPADANRFGGAFYDAGGLYFGSDAQGWNLIQPPSTPLFDSEFYLQTHAYASRISSHVTAIEGLIDSGLNWETLTFGERLVDWLEGYGVTSSTGAGDDADGDGLSNLEEYLSESDPGDNEIFRMPMKVELLAGGIHRVTLVESLDFAGRGLTTLLEVSSDLTTWVPATGFTEQSNTTDGPAGFRTRVIEATPGGAVAAYYRLKITLN